MSIKTRLVGKKTYALLDTPSFLAQLAYFAQEHTNFGTESLAEFIQILSEINVNCPAYPGERVMLRTPSTLKGTCSHAVARIALIISSLCLSLSALQAKRVMVNNQFPPGVSSTYSLKRFGAVLCVPYPFSESHQLLDESLSVKFSVVVPH
jgi:hypothetical protein